MRISIEIEIPGANGDGISLTTSSGSTTSSSGVGGQEHDAGGPPADLVDQYVATADESFEEIGWADAGPAPESPSLEGSGDASSNGGANTGQPEDAGGPPQL